MADKKNGCKAELSSDKISEIKLFGDITSWSAESFISEISYLQKYEKPDKIKISINSQGGSVLAGMQIFSAILDCEIATECVNDGIAASIASVIWAAADVSLMKDYAILMIHNPFAAQLNAESDVLKSFKKQIETVYNKRWGMSKEKVKALMDGEEGHDGTFFDAKEAVAQGIIPATNIIKTSKQKRDMVKNAIGDNYEVNNLTKVFACIDLEGAAKTENKPEEEPSAIHNKSNNADNSETAEENQINNNVQSMNGKLTDLTSICASLGLGEGSSIEDIQNAIKSFQDVKAQLLEANNTITSLTINLEGEKAKTVNVQNDLAAVKDQLSVYEEKERQLFNAKVLELVENSIKDGKILDTAKDSWMEMAKTNFELAKNTLDNIPARQVISKEIANDPVNSKAAAENSPEKTEREIEAKVMNVVGKEFQFKSKSNI